MTKEELDKKQTEEVQGGTEAHWLTGLSDDKMVLRAPAAAAKASGPGFYTDVVCSK